MTHVSGHLPRSFKWGSPSPQDGGHQPSRQISGAARNRYSVDINAQKLVRQAYGTGDPVRLTARASQTQVPVEIVSPSLQQHSDVSEPNRPNSPVAQEMEATKTNTILRPQHSPPQAFPPQ